MATYLLHREASQNAFTHSLLKKFSISNTRVNRVKNIHLASDFRSRIVAKLAESHIIKHFEGKSVAGKTQSVHFVFIFTNVKNRLWVLSSGENQSMTKLVVTILARYESH